MLFKRRKSLPLHKRTREILWPSMGLRRTGRYFGYRLARLPGSSYSIAAGFAVGIGVSFSPLLGTHVFQCLLFCPLLRVNMLAAMIGTLFANPWTIPLFLALTYETTRGAFEVLGLGYFTPMPDDITMQFLLDNPFTLMVPWAMTGLVIGSLAAFISYFPIHSFIKGTRGKRRSKMRRRA